MLAATPDIDLAGVAIPTYYQVLTSYPGSIVPSPATSAAALACSDVTCLVSLVSFTITNFPAQRLNVEQQFLGTFPAHMTKPAEKAAA